MKKGVIIAIIVAVVLAGGAVVWAMNNDSKDEPTPETVNDTTINEDTTNTTNTNNDQSTSSDDNASATDEVEIEDMAFSPANITVKKGTKVTWTNKDDIVHTATSTSGPTSFDSGNLSKDQSFSFIFNETGTYNYHCTPHPQMTGTVTVTE